MIDKIDALIEEAVNRIETIEENSGRTHPDGSTDKDPGLDNKERARIDAARDKHVNDEAAEPDIDTSSPSHMSSILNKISTAAEDSNAF